MSPKIEVSSLKELEKISVDLVKLFKIPQVVLLSGKMATGKTTMVKFMAEALGVQAELITSPTFSLINSYKTKTKQQIYHIDLYRILLDKELENLAFWDLFEEKTVIFIEWPDLVKDKIPPLWNQFFIELELFKDSRLLKWSVTK